MPVRRRAESDGNIAGLAGTNARSAGIALGEGGVSADASDRDCRVAGVGEGRRLGTAGVYGPDVKAQAAWI
jgi:hypothetical protein